ncbi:MAG: excinuclease ABC subunit UvrA [Candidatus Pacebacteria bacterium]|nr:excinuclease ABC subunit UvrA [Candidatus Paceibacterota bacterium]MDD5445992.1 excinuclease ABC subunit UvrA [Candidatus Paceibacterota bacterium]
MKEKIIIKGAREHNLKNVNLEIPRNKLTVFTGVSGSGKSSLAFDTIFAEGQRRYVESLSAYARQFLVKLDKPDVDEIEGLSPAISIDQKSHSSNPRSTVATITEIYDFLRVLFSSIGKPHCPLCNKELQTLTLSQIVDKIAGFSSEENIIIMAPVVRGRKGEYYQLLYDFLNLGFKEARIDGEFKSLRERIILLKNKKHNIDIVIDKIPGNTDFNEKENRLRLSEAVETGLLKGGGTVYVLIDKKEHLFSEKLSCFKDNFSYPAIEPKLFSFNSPYGACPDCNGLGLKYPWSNERCSLCQGKRLRKEALSVLINKKNIWEITEMPVALSLDFFTALKDSFSEKEKEIAENSLREIIRRLGFLSKIGLDYLTLSRKSNTLSGGELQRIRLASQIGSGLVGTLYILDEPTIGLHQKDNNRLIKTLEELRDLGNTIIVVEHDEETIFASDYMVDFGPGAGVHGGEIVAFGETKKLLKGNDKNSLTLQYLKGEKEIPVPTRRRKIGTSPFLKIRGAFENNLKKINVDIPLQRFVAITGVSGSGKSTLVYDILYKHLSNKFYRTKMKEGKYKAILGLEYIDKVINIDQSPIGRTPRSNPATYTGAFTHIRDLFAYTQESRYRGYKSGRFSFNVPGGRCENCKGYGYISIEMHFLPTVYVTCDVCQGKRFDRETLEVKYQGKNIYEVLKMTVEEALDFFDDIPWIEQKMKTLNEVGLGYLQLGQSATTLSGGEAQRVKLCSELSRRDSRKTLYLLDEPTVGLHYDDVSKLIVVLQKLVDRGNSVIVIEHNLDVIKSSDHIIDLGPGAGEKGGEVIAFGTPQEVARKKISATGEYLREKLPKEKQ